VGFVAGLLPGFAAGLAVFDARGLVGFFAAGLLPGFAAGLAVFDTRGLVGFFAAGLSAGFAGRGFAGFALRFACLFARDMTWTTLANCRRRRLFVRP
jgi:hypothetical protein